MLGTWKENGNIHGKRPHLHGGHAPLSQLELPERAKKWEINQRGHTPVRDVGHLVVDARRHPRPGGPGQLVDEPG